MRNFVIEVLSREAQHVQQHTVVPRYDRTSALLYADVPKPDGQVVRVWGRTPEQVAEAFGYALMRELGSPPYRLFINGVSVLQKEMT